MYNITIEGQDIVQVAMFQYLVGIIDSQGIPGDEINGRIVTNRKTIRGLFKKYLEF